MTTADKSFIESFSFLKKTAVIIFSVKTVEITEIKINKNDFIPHKKIETKIDGSNAKITSVIIFSTVSLA